MLPQPAAEHLIRSIHSCTNEEGLVSALRLQNFMHRNGKQASQRTYSGSSSNTEGQFSVSLAKIHCAWGSLLNGYIQSGHIRHAFTLLEQTKEGSFCPSERTFVALLKVCSKLKDLKQTDKIYAQILNEGLVRRNLFIASSLVDAYTKCGALAKAEQIFNALPNRDVVVWTTLISAYVQHERGHEALEHFEGMLRSGVFPNSVTYGCILKACNIVGAIDKGCEIHAEVIRKGLLAKDVILNGAIVDMYAKFGMLGKAREVFIHLPIRDAVVWNVLLTGYAQFGYGEEALKCFQKMQLEGHTPDVITYVACLKACGSLREDEKGREIHAEILRRRLLEKHSVLSNALVDMYAKCGLLMKAHEVFDRMDASNVISWTALIGGYVECDQGSDALDCFERMQSHGISPNAVTFACGVRACTIAGLTDKGIKMHSEIVRIGLLRKDLILGNTLVDMYAKCGLLTKAQEVFDSVPKHNVVSWTALITGYAQLGHIQIVHSLFHKMREEGAYPNPITFISVLNACSHVGLVDKGHTYFESMTKAFGITPTLEHLSCMIDLLSRAGQLDRAVTILEETPFHPTVVMWLTVLAACRKWGEVKLGKHAFEQAIRMDDKESSVYLCMFNIYIDAGMKEEAQCVEAMRIRNRATRKRSRLNWMESE